ncbi:MAG TPA: ribosome assembly RNA-binding protein YhbY [Halanaerobiaceae bacterium]|jgi:RNA-binding protein|nr:ribosome assembly RNA-binding protein YhbY [Bacillota bacterium]HHU93118.1 ribosome assembly RNA-binding protein YhbY [Halanaerobiaceae bacterium]HOA41181.1 ribosome assembly RNA-binding protein YhbY [Halanaerobiales bacterium]HPZ63239.1 ribosome assembly RNA-binding protein YhbY [Halanaerobiales bacterium]HQD04465.1 ribosome assembly RNA-binding protein YhbY [Halanaerobiales bacterium]
MLRGKQRSYLKGQANKLNPIIHVGKGGLDQALIDQMDEALAAHELVKGKVLKNSLEEVRDVAEKLATSCEAEVVQVIGNVFILYRRNKEKPIYILPQ